MQYISSENIFMNTSHLCDFSSVSIDLKTLAGKVNSSLIDLILNNNRYKYLSGGVLHSHHCPIVYIRDTKQQNTNPLLIKKRHFKTFSPQWFLLVLL